MAAVIPNQISERNFELIRDRIGIILTEELAAQNFTSDLGLEVWSERQIAFNQSELPAVNISYDNSGYNSKNVSFKSGENRFFIDVFASDPSNDTEKGDVLAAKKVQRIAGIIDYILESPYYKTLGFDPGLISTSLVENLDMGGMREDDTEHNLACRITFKVVAKETTAQIQPSPAEGYDTQVKLSLTDFGHKYTLDNE